MKIESRNLAFMGVNPWFGRRSLRFVGNENTIQLLETALVIEGYRKTVGYPLIDILFQWALSEWTTVTVPYSRIVKCRYSRRWLMRAIFFLCLQLPVLALFGVSIVWMLLSGYHEDLAVALTLMTLSAVLFLVFLWLMIRGIPARYNLQFRFPGRKLGATNFRIKNRALGQAFEEKLAANRMAALDS